MRTAMSYSDVNEAGCVRRTLCCLFLGVLLNVGTCERSYGAKYPEMSRMSCVKLDA